MFRPFSSEQQQTVPPRGKTSPPAAATRPLFSACRHTSLDVSSLSEDQLECLCQCLENCTNFRGLAILVGRVEESCGSLDTHSSRNVLHRAKALALFHGHQFDELYNFIESNQFAHRDHPLLQTMWNEAHYAQAEQQRGRRLDPVSRYRVRKRNAFPRSIWDGEGTSYCFKKSARQILRETYRRQCMPSQEEKLRLAGITQLSVLQVSNWFKNQRQRARQHQQERRHREEHRVPSSMESENGDGEEDEEQHIAAGDGPSPGAAAKRPKCTSRRRSPI